MTSPADPAATSNLADLLRQARLDEARQLLSGRVRAAPADARARLDLAELLLVLGEWDKADTHAELAAGHDPARAVGVALLRQLIRAAAWRDATFADRRPPDLVTEPDAAVEAALARLAGAEPRGDDTILTGTLDGAPFEGWRDLDDRAAGVLEVLTGNGRYLWIPLAAVASLRPAKPERLRDLIWRPAEIEVRGGPAGSVYLPVLYPFGAGEGDPALRLGRETRWVEEDGGVRGLGQRCWLVGDEVVTLDAVTEIGVAA